MEEVSGPVVAIALILAAVFVPVGFMAGITGRFYQQFAITIAISVLLSAFNALTLSPALSALMLKAPTGKKTLLTPFYGWFNRVFGRGTDAYVSFTSILVRKMVRSLVFIGVLTVLIGGLVSRVPAGFIPEEDQGYLLAQVNLPDASSLERTDLVMKKAEAILAANEAVEGYNTVTGFSLVTGAYSSNQGFFFIQLKEWEHRTTAEAHANGVVAALNKAFAQQIPEAVAVAFGPPAIPGLGTGAGFTLQLQDRSGGSPEFLAQQAALFIEAARKRPEIGRVSTLFRASVPQVYADIDRSKVLKVGVPISDVNTTLGALLGSSYVNDFNRFGRVYKVYVQAEPEFRRDDEAAGSLLRAQRQGGDDPPRHPDLDPAHVRAGVHQPLQPVPLRRGQRGARARVLLGAGPRRARRDREGGPAAGDGLRVGGHVVPGEGAPRTRCPPSRSPSSWCSSCWRRSTRAGRCPSACCSARPSPPSGPTSACGRRASSRRAT